MARKPPWAQAGDAAAQEPRARSGAALTVLESYGISSTRGAWSAGTDGETWGTLWSVADRARTRARRGCRSAPVEVRWKSACFALRAYTVTCDNVVGEGGLELRFKAYLRVLECTGYGL